MLCTANDLLGWKDFPSGLSVLLLDEDSDSAAQMKARLEDMKYIVSWFQNENEAVLAITCKSVEFHIAIVEVNNSNRDEVYRFLEMAKDLPTILISNVHCLNTMMKCIALGAVEFLQKPLSDDKLRNIWQHVIHKAFNGGSSGGEKDVSESLKPIKESLVSMLLQIGCCNESEQSNTSMQENKYPAPSTPQLKQGVRSLDDQTQDSSVEQDGGEYTKFVETTFCDSVSQTTPPPGDGVIKRERESSPEQNGNYNHRSERSKDARVTSKKQPGFNGSCEVTTKAYKRKLKVDWTPELHKKFVQAVEQLGVDQAIPSRILELMKVEGLTRHNVASHLQKYRMHRRHILPKEDERRWLLSRDTTQRTYYPHKQPIMAFPQYHSTNALPARQFYSAWGSYPGVHVWGSPCHYPGWQQREDWDWKTNAGVYAHAWGCPIIPPPHGSYATLSQNALGGRCMSSGTPEGYGMPEKKTFDIQPAEEVIDNVVKEALDNPWMPLPLGLKPPSTDSVLNELSKQGISTIPPPVNGSHMC